MLHVTNGDVAAETIFRSRLEGPVLPWRDVLTDGPVPWRGDDAALRQARGAYLAEAFDDEEAVKTLAERDGILADAAERSEEVVLWFEHDLYDQLQLIQVLDMLSRIPGRKAKVSLICINRHPAIERFLGLGQLTPEQMEALFPSRISVTEEMYAAAPIAWRAFTVDDPKALSAAFDQDLSALPFLHPALRRWCLEFPWTTDGLTQTERMALTVIESGKAGPIDIFRDYYDREQAPFLGDWSYWVRIEHLLSRTEPPIRVSPGPDFDFPPKSDYGRSFERQTFALTEHGKRLLEGSADAVCATDGSRWYGGYRLDPGAAHWRWDPTAGSLVQHES